MDGSPITHAKAYWPGSSPSAALAADCPVAPTTKTFAQFGDVNDYALAPGGDFESLSWTKLGRVGLEAVNDPFLLPPGHNRHDAQRAADRHEQRP